MICHVDFTEYDLERIYRDPIRLWGISFYLQAIIATFVRFTIKEKVMIGLREIQDLLYSIKVMMLQDLALDHLKREESVEGLFSGDFQLNLLFLKKVRIIQHVLSESHLIF